MRTWLPYFLVVPCLLCGCDDGSTADPTPADAAVDGTVAPDGSRDQGVRDAARPDARLVDGDVVDAARPDGHVVDAASLDAALLDAALLDAALLDAALLDAAPDQGPPAETELVLAAEGLDDFDLVGGFRLIDPGASVRLPVALPAELAAVPTLGLVVDAQVWRFEDGEVEVDFGDGPQPALLPGDGRGGPVFLRLRDAGPVAGPTGDFPLFPIPSHGLQAITLTARGGVLGFAQARLVDVRHPVPERRRVADDPAEAVRLPVAPCGEGCDDGAALSAAIAAADPAVPLVVELSGRYVLHTPVEVRRSAVRLAGTTIDTVLFWDPAADAPRGAVQFVGRGRQAGPLAIDASVEGRRHFPTAAAWAGGEYAALAADDFGPVPAVCANGRDMEHRQRHISQLVRVLGSTGDQVVVDRPLNLAIPPEANARLEPVNLLSDVGVRDVRFEANCPDALVNPLFTTATCANPRVLGDAAVLFEWVAGARIRRVEARGFGKFSVELSHTLEADVSAYHMDHPSDFGDGGQGYGVHLITASRTVVHEVEVVHARHGVVVDFGSSDSQVLESHFRDMTQALVDVHGEASRDTLIRENTFEDSQLAVIVGGGGGFAHCNDGPRHHILRNTMAGITNSGLTVFFESPQVYIRHNRISGALFGLTVALDASDVLAERNVFAGARIPVQVAAAGPVHLRGNVFADVCSADLAAMALGGQLIVDADNTFCP